MNVRHIGADLKVTARSYLRNPVALFFSLIFPIILIGLFGLIFSSIGNSSVTLEVLNEDHNSAVSQQFLSALNNTSVVKVSLITDSSVTPSNFAAWLGQNDDPVGLVIPAGFAANYTHRSPVNLTLFTNPTDASSSGTALGAVTGVANGFNLAAAGGSPIIQIPTPRTVGSQVLTYIDFLIPGLIGFSILTSPMFSMVDISSSYRKDGIFRELSLTPLTRAEWLTSRILWYVGLTFVTAGIMIGAGVYLFNAHVGLTLGIVPFLIVGPFLFVSLGMLAGSVAKTPESAALIGNIITFPMMFLSGTFFQVSAFPPGLQTFAHILPLYYVIDGMNQVMLFSNSARALTDLTVVFVTAVVFFVLAIRFFKWRDE
ncbi:MAG: ABC transporter permease [Thermoplasmata archaeon]|jgi:ABC-2 type transport system permease protein